MTTAVTVLVTGVGGGGHGEQVLKALRLAETPYQIVGTDISPYSSGLRDVDHSYLVPRAHEPNYIDVVLAICAQHGVQVAIHGSEPELLAMSRHRRRFQERGILLPINPPDVIDRCMDKVQTMQMLDEVGAATPAWRAIRNVDEALEFDHLPAIMKPSVGGGGSVGLHLVQDRAALRMAASELLAETDQALIQAYVGTPEDEYTVGVLCDLDGQLLNSIAVRRWLGSTISTKIRVPNQSPRSELGSTLVVSSGVSQGEIGRFPEVTEQCEAVAQAIGACGPLNIQCRLVEGKARIFEINPRFSGTTSLRALVGYNEPDVLIRRHILGEDIAAHFEYGEGTIVRKLDERLLDPRTIRRGEDLL